MYLNLGCIAAVLPLSDQFGSKTARHIFCPICGVQAFYVPRSNPDGYAVTIACLNEADLAMGEIQIRVQKYDGVNWEKAYGETGIEAMSKDKGVEIGHGHGL